ARSARGAHESALLPSVASVRLDEFAVAGEPDEAVAVLRSLRRARPMAVGNQDVDGWCGAARHRLEKGVGAGLGYAGLAQRQEELAFGTELEHLVPAHARVRRVTE